MSVNTIRIPSPTKKAIAAADLSDFQYGIVTIDTVTTKVKKAGANDTNLYILQNKPKAGQVAEIANADGCQSYVKASAALNVGTRINAHTNGLAVTAAATKYSFAIIDEKALAANDIVICTFEKMYIPA